MAMELGSKESLTAMDALRAARIDNIALITERRPDRSGRTNR